MKGIRLYNESFEGLFKDFDRSVKAQGYSGSHGSPSFHYAIREFLSFLEGLGIDRMDQVEVKHVVSYYDYLENRPNLRRGGGLSASVLRKHLLSLRLFFDHLVFIGCTSFSPVHLPSFSGLKVSERIPLSVDEVELLYKACETKRDKALLGLAYGCGLRKGELESLQVQDIAFTEGVLTVRSGKFGKSRMVPVSDHVLTDLRGYLVNERGSYLNGKLDSGCFLLNHQGGRMSGLSMNTRLKVLVKRTHCPTLLCRDISLHHLRHSIATHLLDKGANMEFVQEFLGHSQLDTTHIYAKRRKKRALIKEAFENYEPLRKAS